MYYFDVFMFNLQIIKNRVFFSRVYYENVLVCHIN